MQQRRGRHLSRAQGVGRSDGRQSASERSYAGPCPRCHRPRRVRGVETQRIRRGDNAGRTSLTHTHTHTPHIARHTSLPPLASSVHLTLLREHHYHTTSPPYIIGRALSLSTQTLARWRWTWMTWIARCELPIVCSVYAWARCELPIVCSVYAWCSGVVCGNILRY